MDVMRQYGFVGLFSFLALGFAVIGVVLAWLLRPKKPNKIKNDTYECGLETVGDTWVQFRPQYYLFALIFLVFDIEAIFLFPWAVAYGQLGLYALVMMTIFVVILLASLLYAWKKKDLEWQ